MHGGRDEVHEDTDAERLDTIRERTIWEVAEPCQEWLKTTRSARRMATRMVVMKNEAAFDRDRFMQFVFIPVYTSGY